MLPVKAIVEVLDRDAIDPSRGLLPLFEVQFNPTEWTQQKGAQIAEINIPGIDSPLLQFIRGQNERLTLDLFFDTTDGGMLAPTTDVRTQTRGFYELVKMQSRTHAPPRVRVTWGEGLSFTAIVESVQQKFSLFSPTGVPLRATLAVAFREYKPLDEQLRELKLQSTDQSKTRRVRKTDTLSRIAFEEYRDATAWRHIAEANPGVTNPRRLEPGTILTIPPLDVFSAPTLGRGTGRP